MSLEEERRVRGLETLQAITGAPGQAVLDSLKEIAPEYGEWMVDFAYGQVLSRPGLDKRSRQFATVAALTVMGHALPQLKVHINGALNVGCKPSEIVETILQMGLYGGWPCVINALGVAREVFKERGVPPRG